MSYERPSKEPQNPLWARLGQGRVQSPKDKGWVEYDDELVGTRPASTEELLCKMS